MTPYIYVGIFENYTPIGILTKEQILKTICYEFDMDYNEVKNKKTRLSKFVYVRQLYAYFCKIYTKDSLTKIGKFINKDHATVIFSIKKISGYIDIDKEVKKHVSKLNNILKNKIVDYSSEKREEIGKIIMEKYN
jgi:chromosomal replication initiator protein